MSNLPDGWTTEKLGSLTDRTRPICYGVLKPGSFDPFGVPLLRIQDLTGNLVADDGFHFISQHLDNEFRRSRLEGGEVLLSIQGTIGRTAIVPSRLAGANISRTLARICPDGSLNPKFLYLYFQHLTSKNSYDTGGTTRSSLNIGTIRNMIVPLPPAAEQIRIVAAVEEQFSRLDAGMTALEHAQANIRKMREAIRFAAVTGRLAPRDVGESDHELLLDNDSLRRLRWKEHSDKKYSEPVAPAEIRNLSLPRHWSLASLEALTDPVRTICYGILMPRVREGGEIPYVEVKDLRPARLNLQDLHKTSRELNSAFPRSVLKGRDVVLAIRGSFDRALVVPPELGGANMSRDVARIAPLSFLNSDFLVLYLTSPPALQYLRERSRGVAVKGVNIADLRSMPIPLPPKKEQEEIVEIWREHESMIQSMDEAVAHAIDRSGRLRSSLLDRAFSGRLVPQDPSDEPGSILLERIAAEQVSTSGQPAKRGRQPRATSERLGV